MTGDHDAALELLVRLPGIQGAMLVSRRDGIVIAEAVMEDVRGAALAALAASLLARLEAAARAAEGGDPAFLHLQAAGGAVFVMPAGEEILIVAIGERDANAGRVRLEMARAAERVA